MRYMLDTDCCIELLRGRTPRAVERIAQVGLEQVHVSSITVGELLVGAARSSKPKENTARVVQFCASLQIVPFDDRAAARYAQTRASLEILGTPIGPMDMLIAGHALALDATLVTGNVREFGRVVGLRVENWLGRSR
ncbi:MAG: type II toxin-antitoxin system VapC family toxin [Limnohabitans sp.]|nr:type II toxin-antitoxin system VapC family toxin [Limnohabitans sp.]